MNNLTDEKLVENSHEAETALTDPVYGAVGSAILNDQDFLRLAPALDLSTAEWLRVFQAHNGPPSFTRELFQITPEQQIQRLAWSIHDDDPCLESVELSRRIEALPRTLKVTVLEAIERFWTPEAEGSSLDERLQNLGLRPCESAHAHAAALAHRQRVIPTGRSDGGAI